MNIVIECLRKVLKFIRILIKQYNPIGVERQKEYIKGLSTPLDDIHRSFLQYKCQSLLLGEFVCIIFNVFSFFIEFLVLIVFLCRSKPTTIEQHNAVFISNGLANSIIPDEITNTYDDILFVLNKDMKYKIDKESLKVILKIIRKHPLSWYFILKCTIKLGSYNYLLLKYRPDAIIASVEYSFTSSILTNYCEKYNVEHINIMHGEMIFNIMRSFYRFTKFYVWDDHYVTLSHKLCADNTKYIVSKPRHLFLDEIDNDYTEYDYTYYVGHETGNELKKIAEYLAALKDESNKIAIRPHPVFSKIEKQKEMDFFLQHDIDVEDLSQITINDSIMRSKTIIAQHSTVLYQAYLNGKNVVIDDLTNKEAFDILKESDYIMFEKPHRLLSQIVINNLK